MVGLPVFPPYNHLHRATSAPSSRSPPQPAGSAVEVRREVWARSTNRSVFKPSVCFLRFFCFSLHLFFCNQVLLFPALSFIQDGRLSSLEFVTQELSAQTHVRFQTYRPHCHYPGRHLLLPGESNRDGHTLTHTLFLVSIKQVLKKINDKPPESVLPIVRTYTD